MTAGMMPRPVPDWYKSIHVGSDTDVTANDLILSALRLLDNEYEALESTTRAYSAVAEEWDGNERDPIDNEDLDRGTALVETMTDSVALLNEEVTAMVADIRRFVKGA